MPAWAKEIHRKHMDKHTSRGGMGPPTLAKVPITQAPPPPMGWRGAGSGAGAHLGSTQTARDFFLSLYSLSRLIPH